jgi:hypothetical protein
VIATEGTKTSVDFSKQFADAVDFNFVDCTGPQQ